MESTVFITNNNQLIMNRAYSYSTGENGFVKNTLNSTTVGARGIQSTVEDLCKWVSNFTNPIIGGNGVINEMNKLSESTPFKYNYGLAINKYHDLNVIEHDGSDAGYRTYIGRFPEQNFSIIILSNYAAINPKAIAMQATDVYLFNQNVSSILGSKGVEKIEVPESVEKGMEGQFKIGPDKVFSIWSDDHSLRGTINNDKKLYYLIPTSKTEFEIKDLNAKIIFDKDSIVYRTGNSSTKLIKTFIEDEESLKLREYEGEYYSEELGVTYNISKVENMLRVTLPRDGVINLKKQNDDNFTGSYYWFRKIKFTRNAGKLSGFELSTGRSYNVKFIKTNK